MQIAANSVKLISGGNVIKQGDETPFIFQLNDETGDVVNLQGATVVIQIANQKTLILEKTATINSDNTITFSLTEDDVIGNGSMRLEFEVIYSTGKKELFPANGWQEIKITPSLKDLNASGGVAIITVAKLTSDVNKAVVDSKTALNTANNVQTQFDSVVNRATDTDAMSRQASINTDGVDKVNLKIRLDDDYNKITSELAQKLTQGNVSVSDINKNLGKLDQTYMTDEFLQQIAGTTPINAVPADDSLTLKKTTFYKTGKNLFDKNDVTEGYYLTSSGALWTSASYSTSNYINVKANSPYSFTNVYRIAFYKSDMTLSVYYSTISNPIIAPADAVYLRVSIMNSNLDTTQVEQSNTPTSYESFKRFIPAEYTEKHDFNVNDIPKKSLGIEKTNYVTIGKNLFNKETVETGFYVNNANGTLSSNASYTASDYIGVEASAQYAISHEANTRIAYYDINKKYISGVYPVTSPITTPANCAFIRFSVVNAAVETAQLEKGSVKTAYEPYGYTIPKLLINGAEKEEVLIFLPSEICIAVGRTIELYNKQVVWCGNINNYHFKWSCAVGRSMKRKWTYTGSAEKIGTYPLTLTVYNNNMKEVAKATTTIKVVTNVLANPKNILTIGDSLTNGKQWIGELRTLSSSQLTLVGTRGIAPHQHEGRSGFSAREYLEGTAYPFESEGIHPFWDGTRFNWNYYKTQTGVNPSAIQIFLGTNEMEIDPTTNANNIKQIVDYIRQDDATIPLFVVFTLYRGNQDGIGNQLSTDGYSAGSGVWKLEEDRKVFNLIVRLNDLLKTYTNLYFVPIALAHDSEYNFGAVETPVNPRASQTELFPTEATHPQIQGYYQMADIMFSAMAAHLN